MLNEVDTNKSGGSLWVREGGGEGEGRGGRGGYPSFNELR